MQRIHTLRVTTMLRSPMIIKNDLILKMTPENRSKAFHNYMLYTERRSVSETATEFDLLSF